MQRVADLPGAPPRSGEPVEAPLPAQDGRRARWTEHRSARVSKTVIYRYFTDKDELVDAVLTRISDVILVPRLLGEIAREHADDRSKLRAVIAAFVALIEDEPELYRFAYAHTGRSGRADLVAGTEHQIAEALGALMVDRLTQAGRPADGAMTWAYGVVGMVQLASHWWSV